MSFPIAAMAEAVLDVPPVPASLAYTWAFPTSNNAILNITNPNDAAMTVSFGAWALSSVFTWVTTWPQTIAARGTLAVTAHANDPGLGNEKTSWANGTWSVTGGGSGTLAATGDAIH